MDEHLLSLKKLLQGDEIRTIEDIICPFCGYLASLYIDTTTQTIRIVCNGRCFSNFDFYQLVEDDKILFRHMVYNLLKDINRNLWFLDKLKPMRSLRAEMKKIENTIQSIIPVNHFICNLMGDISDESKAL